MPISINSPVPASLGAECRKAAKILREFIDPRQALGADKIIPPLVLTEAKGLAILTVVKAGCLASVRMGSGLVIARLPDGSWSAPSALATTGVGFGSQIGAEITDFVMILNDFAAVRTFSEAGSLTIGGNVSVAAGPLGRNAEASGATSMRSGVAAIFSYSKTKGLFAGVSLEGSVLLERKDANRKFYGSAISAKQLLSGSVAPPASAEALYSVLNSRAFNMRAGSCPKEDIFADVPAEPGWGAERRSSHPNPSWDFERTDSFGSRGTRARSSTWQEDSARYPRDPDLDFDRYQDSPPATKKPVFSPGGLQRAATLKPNQAVALYTFKAVEDGDLPFKKGDIITITKRTQSSNDWWTGECNGRTGIFPSNYVQPASS